MSKRITKIFILTIALSFGAAIIGAALPNNSVGFAESGWCTDC